MNRHCRALTVALLSYSALSGCGSENANLSTRADDDPTRWETARVEVEEAQRRSRQAESARFGEALQGVEAP